MVGWMDDEALHRTLTTGRATYWSRSRQQYWVKGETSGHVQLVKSVALDCDGDVAPGQGRPGRRGLPHRRSDLLRPRSVAGRHRGRGADGVVDVMSASIGRRDLGDLARTHRLVPITRTLFADAETPVGVYRKLAADRPGTFLLESAEPGRSFSRWSFVGVNAVATLSTRAARRSGPARSRTECRRTAIRWRCWARRGARCAGRGYRDCRRSPAVSSATSATTWCAGSRRCRQKADDDLGLPELTMLLVTDLAAVDHHECTVVLIANAVVHTGMTADELDAAYDDATAPPGSHAGRTRHSGATDGGHDRPARPEGGGIPYPARGVPTGGRAGARGRAGRRGVPDPGRPAVPGRHRRPIRSTSIGCCARSTRRRTCTSCGCPTSTSSAPARRRWSR